MGSPDSERMPTDLAGGFQKFKTTPTGCREGSVLVGSRPPTRKRVRRLTKPSHTQ